MIIDHGDRMYRDETLNEELCYMCLSHKKLYRAEHTSPNRKEIYVCKDCIDMNGHRRLDD